MSTSTATNVYIDGFNLYYGCLRGTPYKWLDLDALCRRILPGSPIRQIRYFSALVKARPGSDPQGPIRQQTYLRALGTYSPISVHLGHFLITYPRMPLRVPTPGGPRTIEVIKTEEKGSDVNLATYMMLDACQGKCDTVVLITNDSDLAEPLRLLRSELGIRTTVVNPHARHNRSRVLIADDYKQLRPATLAACQLPPQLIDRAGRKIHRPPAW